MSNGSTSLLVEMLTQYKRLQVDNMALLWNGAAFGILGDVTRDELEEDEMTEEEKKDWGWNPNKTAEQREIDRRKPKSRFSQNLIFANMFAGAVSQWANYYAYHVTEAVGSELQKIQHDDALRNALENPGENVHNQVKSHHQDEHGMFMPYELLRREVFKQWAVDKGLIRGILRHVIDDLKADRKLADFGAGGGHYAKFFNETGLVQAYAYDGIEGVEEVTKGASRHWNLAAKNQAPHWTTYDYGMSLEVLEHIPEALEEDVIATISKNVRRSLVMSWSNDREGIGHVNCKSPEEYRKIVEKYGFKFNPEKTDKVREMITIEYLALSISVFDKVDGGEQPWLR